ncbi:twin-arginine translocase TatA/TatE family subunit [Rhizobium ruizarguesonis]|uniref:Sec-independent protein translocase protein TatA n=1 Tax=Rhizobium ruizarguesonis TaxID=2081791 RepID=A0AAE8Q3Q6_9HYPH|nr:twin-arginine translocase TatA/TatE family subunit [Rhizobium ruizarguesonis]TBC12703.1 twin-arginine translocase TatA/TatE family subunit [Rhizobium ruizarguesonis]TBF00949.1 twin-arginine translocase TatA/TatE family subunit [Rhizobium ruizarguesonis]TCA23029.1 twin-arginine translocase TatA/TatE family subunit [Rhizobium leguminosarum bv. viciae]
MGALSFWHLAIVTLVVLVLFGRGRLSALMGDVGKGLRTFRRELFGTQRSIEDTERRMKKDKFRL